MRRRAPRRAQAGFTLFELLLALSLLTLITSALLAGLHLGRKAFEASRANQAAAELEAAAVALANLLSHAYPAVAPDAKMGQRSVFAGHSDQCFFVSLSEGETHPGGLLVAEIGLEQNGAGADLSVWTDLFGGEAVDSLTRNVMRKTEAARNVSYFNLSYFGVLEDGKPPRWSDSWIDLDHLPLLVAVKFGAVRFGRPIDIAFDVALRQQPKQP